MIVHRKTSPRKKYIHGRGFVIRLNLLPTVVAEEPRENDKKAASEIKYGNGFQVL
jgi:hypothetical protein